MCHVPDPVIPIYPADTGLGKAPRARFRTRASRVSAWNVYCCAMDTRTAIDGEFFRDLRRPVDFWILRHGESQGNAQGRIQGLADYELSDVGRAQAREAGRWFATRGVAAVLSSPLKRAAETAAIVAQEAGLPAPRQEPILSELDAGPFSGLNWKEIKERHPADYERFGYLSWDGVEGAEHSDSMLRRAKDAWKTLRAEAMARPGGVLAVTHGGVMQWLVRCTFGWSSWLPILPTGNCCVYRLSVKPNGNGLPPYMEWADLNRSTSVGMPAVPPMF